MVSLFYVLINGVDDKYFVIFVCVNSWGNFFGIVCGIGFYLVFFVGFECSVKGL